jgi:hypothetical protein
MFMALISRGERPFLQAVSQLGYSNPFLPERIEFERAALGGDFMEGEPVWSQQVDDPERPRVNVWRIVERLERVAEQLRARLREGAEARAQDLVLYEDAILLLLYQRYYRNFFEAGFGPAAAKTDSTRWRFYNSFLGDWRHFFHIDGVRFPTGHDPRHTFACYRQIQLAFEQVFRDVIGSSMPAARLRASIWQSIFTHDMRRYRRTLYARMGEFATLITGPSGTGKELVARAIAQSRYVPFDDQRLAFAEPAGHPGAGVFFPINISALSPTLVESELFGHRRGAFTGAVADRTGWLESCPELGSVFLDELGDLDPAIQVKLLRVIETRTFYPVGDTAGRQFRGKLITATNRDLAAAIAAGRFREDLYYRLCSDQVTTPSLAEQLADSPGVLRELVCYMARRVAGPGGRRPGTRGHGVDRRQPGNWIRLAGQLPRAGTVREERTDPAQLPSGADGRGRSVRGVRAGCLCRPALGGRVVAPLRHDCLQPHRELRGNRPATGTGPPHGEKQGG